MATPQTCDLAYRCGVLMTALEHVIDLASAEVRAAERAQQLAGIADYATGALSRATAGPPGPATSERNPSK